MEIRHYPEIAGMLLDVATDEKSTLSQCKSELAMLWMSFTLIGASETVGLPHGDHSHRVGVVAAAAEVVHLAEERF